MKVVVQRVKSASVRVEDKCIGSIKKGLLLLVGIHKEDKVQELEWVCEKILKLRIFEDDNEKMNLSIQEIGGELLVVSQFTLYGSVKKGTRPSFIEAADPEYAKELYLKMIDYFKTNSSINIEEGEFGAHMDVELINDGPVTILVEK